MENGFKEMKKFTNDICKYIKYIKRRSLFLTAYRKKRKLLYGNDSFCARFLLDNDMETLLMKAFR